MVQQTVQWTAAMRIFASAGLAIFGWGGLSLQQHAVEMAALREQVRAVDLRMEAITEQLRDFAGRDRRMDDMARRIERCESKNSMVGGAL